MNTIQYFLRFTTVLLLASITACTSVPETQYYTLTADKQPDPALISTNPNQITNIGVGPLVLPNALNNFSVLSLENSNQIVLSVYDLWSGNLQENFNQVLADNLSTYLNIDGVWPFPWDNRNRPMIQIRIVVERFIGELGKEVSLQAKWTLLSDYGRKELKTKKVNLSQPLMDNSYLAYVKGLNQMLNQFSLALATEISNTQF